MSFCAGSRNSSLPHRQRRADRPMARTLPGFLFPQASSSPRPHLAHHTPGPPPRQRSRPPRRSRARMQPAPVEASRTAARCQVDFGSPIHSLAFLPCGSPSDAGRRAHLGQRPPEAIQLAADILRRGRRDNPCHPTRLVPVFLSHAPDSSTAGPGPCPPAPQCGPAALPSAAPRPQSPAATPTVASAHPIGPFPTPQDTGERHRERGGGLEGR